MLLPALYGLLLAFGFFLLFYNLDGRPLWGDEAETATLARNVVRFGYPKTFDGLNRISLYGAEIDNAADVWVWSPWLQEYVAAASFSLFGPTTWAARAPFALIGWFCLPLLGWVAYRIYRNHGVALASIALLASSEVFLLHARQCRYYSISILAEILFIYSLFRWLANDQKGRWLLVLSLLVQFYSNYIMAVANLPVLLFLAWNLYCREKRSVLRLGLHLALLALLVAPWYPLCPAVAPVQRACQTGPDGQGAVLSLRVSFPLCPPGDRSPAVGRLAGRETPACEGIQTALWQPKRGKRRRRARF